ncbi:MAG: hypothetical protein Kow0090_21330 [Myxococcota bacterium]
MMLIAMVMSVFFVLTTFWIVDFTVTQWEKMVADFGMSVMRLGGLIMIFLLGSGVIGRELKRRTAYVIFSRPVKKWEFVVGKFSGIMSLIALNLFILLVLVYIVSYWVHFRIKVETPPLYLGYIEFLCEIAVLAAFVIFLSAIYSQESALIGMFIFFATSHLIGYLKEWLVEGSLPAKLVAYILYIFPDFSYYNVSQKVIEFTDRVGIPRIPVPWDDIITYYLLTILYCSLFLYAGAHFLKRREFGE